MPWLLFDKQNIITAKILRDDVILANYDIISADYDVITRWLKHLVYTFMRFFVQKLINVSLNKHKVKPYKRVFMTLLTIF